MSELEPTPREQLQPPGFAAIYDQNLFSYLPAVGGGAYLVTGDTVRDRIVCYAPPGCNINGDTETYSGGWRSGFWSSTEAFCKEEEPEEVALLSVQEVLEVLPESAEGFVRNRTLEFLCHGDEKTPEIEAKLRAELSEAFSDEEL